MLLRLDLLIRISPNLHFHTEDILLLYFFREISKLVTNTRFREFHFEGRKLFSSELLDLHTKQQGCKDSVQRLLQQFSGVRLDS